MLGDETEVSSWPVRGAPPAAAAAVFFVVLAVVVASGAVPA